LNVNSLAAAKPGSVSVWVMALDALHLILRAMEIGPGDEVIVPSNSNIATWLAVSYAEAVVMPVEPNSQTYNVAPARIEAAITARTKALMPVHLYGQRTDMDPILGISRRHVKVIEHTAQAQDTRYKGRVPGRWGTSRATAIIPAKTSTRSAMPAQ
jgi:dTDP-4-amino-4,6-dideoxygalactose transaminase